LAALGARLARPACRQAGSEGGLFSRKEPAVPKGEKSSANAGDQNKKENRHLNKKRLVVGKISTWGDN